MLLKLMEIYGFKSFADRTKIEFDKGITVIVGPNGCGKSNIVDSAKWVLGEKQAKNIRGDRMDDVIFAGTVNRKSLSIAEVSLLLDNSARNLKFDSDTVHVCRRVFADGVSEYLINKSPVRLKDIEDLFLDTGIGKSSYSFMEQGRIDMILSSKAEDRRYIFEEAAGISRFKLQKKESIRKLEDTKENLDRINDIIHEIEREKDLKARQAEKTKIYLGLKQEFKTNDVKLHTLKVRTLTRKRNKKNEKIAQLKLKLSEISKRISSVSEENEKDEQFKNEIQAKLWDLEKMMQVFKIKTEDIDDKTGKNKKIISQNKERSSQLSQDIEDRNNELVRLKDEKEKTFKNGEEIIKRIADDQEKLKNYFELRKKKIDTIHQCRDNIEKNRLTITGNENELVKLRDELEVVIHQLIEAIERRKEELVSSENARQETRENIHRQFREISEYIEEAKNSAKGSLYENVIMCLDRIDMNLLFKTITEFESYEDGFRSILFDKTGIHAKKEEIDGKIRNKSTVINTCKIDNIELEERIKNLQSELDEVNDMITRIEKDLSRNDNEKMWIEKHQLSLERQIQDLERHIQNIKNELVRIEKSSDELQKEIDEWHMKVVEINEKTISIQDKINEQNQKKEEITAKILSRKESSTKDMSDLNKINSTISNNEKKIIELNFKINNIDEHLWNEYEIRTDNLDKVKVDEIELDSVTKEINTIKSKIQELGPINNLAIDEYEELKKRFEYYINQRKDIEKAREDIFSVINDINKTSIDLFLDTFRQIQKNFSEVFKQLFEGGAAEIILTDTENVLESGIDVTVRPPGKKPKSINLLSGGERTLTAIALLFSTYMVKPSPFCFLDEIDAALDEENVGRFLRMLKQFAEKTQFVMITHNKKTMSVASSIYGITMEEAGVSKVVSVKLEKS